MIALFVNSTNPVCGVYQYGRNLFEVLKSSKRIRWFYCEPYDEEALIEISRQIEPDATLINYQSGIGGFMLNAPFGWMSRPVLAYHDNDIDESRWSAILFSDPTMPPYGKWHPIGRPLPQYEPGMRKFNNGVTFGCHGFLGAWADQLVYRVMQEFESATVRLLLPFAVYGDSNGSSALAMANRCRSMVNKTGITLEISHEFLPQPRLMEWLSANDMNVYIRPTNMGWRGVSSAPDCALAVNRPMAVNKCSAFRHLHHLKPSICVEDSSLTEIFANGQSPLNEFRDKWCNPETIRQQVEDVIARL